MNISQQTNGAHVAATNMTTLLQKNCIKTLSVNNGVVVMGTAPVGNASMINANVVPITATPLTTNVSVATNLQTHTMIANASHIQPIQAFQYQQLQAVTQAQPQYIIYNASDGSMFRPVVNSTAPINAIVTSNSLYQPQSQPQQQQQQSSTTTTAAPTTIFAQNSLPKIGAIKATAIGQQKVLNIVATQKPTTTLNTSTTTITNTTPTTIPPSPSPHTNHTVQHIKRENCVATHQIQQNGTNIIRDNNIIQNPIATTTTTTTASAAAAAGVSQIFSNINQTIAATSALRTEAIKSEALVTTASIGSKAAQSNPTPIHNPNTQNDTFRTASNVNTPPTAAPTTNHTTTNDQPADITNPSTTHETNDDENEPEPEIDIVINNVVCSFSVRCHLNLREIALNGRNVEFRRENGMVTMKLRRPYTTASIWSSGRITCTGATSEDQAKIGARRYARCLQGLGFPVRFNNFRVVNVLGTCSMPWAIKIVNFSEKYKKDASYEPELHPGVTYKLRTPKATLKIFSTGSITVTAGSVADVQAAIEHIFPLVYEFRKKRTVEAPAPVEVYDPDNDEDLNQIMDKYGSNSHSNGETKASGGGGGGGGGVVGGGQKKAIKRKYPFGMSENDPHIDNMIVSDDDINDLDDDDDMDDDL